MYTRAFWSRLNRLTLPNRFLFGCAALVLSSCPPLRPDPSVSSLGACASDQTAVCFGVCATTSAERESCDVNECSTTRPLRVCERTLACVPLSTGSATGICQSANVICNPDSPY